MKIASIISCLLIIGVFQSIEANRVDTPAQLFSISNSQEKDLLIYNCRRIVAEVNERFSSLNAYSSSGRIQTIKQRLTSYLHGVGSSTAMQLLQEMQRNNFKEWTS